GGSKKGLWICAIAAMVLLAAGGGWWYMQQNGHAAAGRGGAPIVAQTNQQPATKPPLEQKLQTATLPQTPPQKPKVAAVSNPAPVNPAASNSKAQTVTPATEVQKLGNGRDGLKPAPVSSASRAAEPVSQPAEDTKRSAFKRLHLAAPSVKRGKASS